MESRDTIEQWEHTETFEMPSYEHSCRHKQLSNNGERNILRITWYVRNMNAVILHSINVCVCDCFFLFAYTAFLFCPSNTLLQAYRKIRATQTPPLTIFHKTRDGRLIDGENLPNMMTAPQFFGSSYPAYHRPSIDSLQAGESPLDLQITNKQRNCESQPLPTSSPAASPRYVANNSIVVYIYYSNNQQKKMVVVPLHICISTYKLK